MSLSTPPLEGASAPVHALGSGHPLQLMTFRVGELSYCMGIEHVTEIVGMQAITSMPQVPPHIKGVINLRGQVIPVLDVRTRFGLPRARRS